MTGHHFKAWTHPELPLTLISAWKTRAKWAKTFRAHRVLFKTEAVKWLLLPPAPRLKPPAAVKNNPGETLAGQKSLPACVISKPGSNAQLESWTSTSRTLYEDRLKLEHRGAKKTEHCEQMWRESPGSGPEPPWGLDSLPVDTQSISKPVCGTETLWGLKQVGWDLLCRLVPALFPPGTTRQRCHRTTAHTRR